MGEFSLTHWLIILIILVLFFGPSRLPGLGQSLGKALRGFKEGLNEKEKDAPTQDANARIESANPTETTRQTESTEKKS